MIRILATAGGVLAAAVFAVTGANAEAGADHLASLQGKSRPVIILSDSRDDPRVTKQIAALDQTKQGLEERNIKVLQDARPGSALRKTLGVAEKGFAVVLVGKDGGVKNVWKEPVEPRRIFAVIDRMPMRREEMSRQ